MRRAIMCLIMAAVALGAPSLRADEPLAHLPADVGAVLRLAPRAQVEPRLHDFFQVAAIDEMAPAAAFETMFSDLLKVAGAQLIRAIDRQSPVYIATILRRDDAGRPIEPAPRVWLFKPTSFDDLRAALRAEVKPEEHDVAKRADGFEELAGTTSAVFLADRAGWALLAEPGVPLERFSVASAAKSSLSSIDPAALKLLQSGDLSMWLNVSQTWAMYAADLQQAKAGMPEAARKQAARDGLDAEQTRQAVVAAEAISTILFTAGDDVEWIGAAASVTKEGVTGDSFIRLTDGSPTAKLVAVCRSSRLDLLDKLPAGAAAYIALHLDREQLDGEGLAKALNLTGDVRDKVVNFLRAARESGWDSSATAMWMPRDPQSGADLVSLDRARDPRKLLAALKALEPNPAVGEAESHQGVAIETAVLPGRAAVKPDPKQAYLPWLLHRLPGETRRLRSAAIDDVAIHTEGRSPQVMRKAIDALQSNQNAAASEPLQNCRGKLPAEASVVVLLDTTAILHDSLNLSWQESVFFGWLASPIDERRLESYFGASLVAESTGLKIQTYLPVEQLRDYGAAAPMKK